jgi:hypothetical protein
LGVREEYEFAAQQRTLQQLLDGGRTRGDGSMHESGTRSYPRIAGDSHVDGHVVVEQHLRTRADKVRNTRMPTRAEGVQATASEGESAPRARPHKT